MAISVAPCCFAHSPSPSACSTQCRYCGFLAAGPPCSAGGNAAGRCGQACATVHLHTWHQAAYVTTKASRACRHILPHAMHALCSHSYEAGRPHTFGSTASTSILLPPSICDSSACLVQRCLSSADGLQHAPQLTLYTRIGSPVLPSTYTLHSDRLPPWLAWKNCCCADDIMCSYMRRLVDAGA